jgi:hypothetical protein
MNIKDQLGNKQTSAHNYGKEKKKKSKPWFPKLSKKMHAEEPMEISSLVLNYRNGNEVKNYMC